MILLCGPQLLLGRPYCEPLLWFMITEKVNRQVEGFYSWIRDQKNCEAKEAAYNSIMVIDLFVESFMLHLEIMLASENMGYGIISVSQMQWVSVLTIILQIINHVILRLACLHHTNKKMSLKGVTSA